MYDWRNLSGEERQEVLASRKRAGQPWHSPPHGFSAEPTWFHVTAACYEHAHFIGHSSERLTSFASELLATLASAGAPIAAWCLLPNHYHVLAKITDLKATTRQLGQLHGRSSRLWNIEDAADGRRVFYRAADRRIRSERHFWATLNYIHQNPVRHGYAERWTDWPWSSLPDFVREQGLQEAERILQAYPILDYGKGWDDAAL